MKSSPAILLALALTFAAQAADDKKAVDPAVASALQKVNATGASLMPIAADAKAYRFTALNVAKEFTDAGLDALAPVADKIASLDLARTKVTDGGLAKLAAMKGLKELHLENTAIGDAGLDHLKGLSELEYLNLYNTKVTDAGLAKLASLGKLKALYLWQTGVTKSGVAALKVKLPKAHVNSGWTAEDDAKPTAIVAAAAPAPAAAAKPAADAAKPAPAAAKPAAAPAAAGAKLDPALAAKAVIYKDVVASIMQAKCVSCHGEEKKKGKLQLHTYAAIIKGGGDGATTVIPSNIKDSLLLVRANLPTDDDEHMPPSDEPQLTKEELAILKWWIETGASETATIASVKAPADVEGALAVLLAKGLPKAAAGPAKVEKPKAKPLTDAEKKQVAEIIAKMQALNASLMPLAQDTEQLRLGVVNAADKFGDKELALLAPIAPHIVWVDLARSHITDAAADTLAKMTNLERLHLENTKVTDAGIAKLGALPKLEYLNLYGTKTTDGGIAKLSTAKGLKKLFVWQTAVTQNGAKALEAQVPGLKVNVGLTEAEIAKLTAPPPAPPPAPAPAKKEEPKKPADAKPAAATAGS
ncbi:MAG TPA: c-type cytochrome domain-containing protein, partial [Prosthecobacter sp.]